MQAFRVIAIFVLVVGAVAGVYLGLGRPGQSVHTARLSFGAATATPSPTVDAGLAQAAALAEARAAAAAVEEAARAKKANEVAQRNEQAASRSESRADYPVPASCQEYTGNRGLGCALLLEVGYGLAEMPCLEKLWTKESRWNEKSQNASSGAYGIPQALPGTKMAAYGADWQTNPVPQIKWGLNYIRNRYATPCGAWAHFQAKNWY